MADPTTDSPVPSQSRTLGLFAKAWDPGKVKTRLAATLGDEAAVAIYLELLTLHLNRFAAAGSLRSVAYSPATDVTKIRFYELLASLQVADAWDLVAQVESDLGSRMSHFFQQQFDACGDGARVVVIGSDMPRLDSGMVAGAFELLAENDVVFGPSADGGYYLVGLSVMSEAIFRNIQWSTEQVLQQSLEICQRESLSVALLPKLNDIDNEDDLNQELTLLDRSDSDTAIFLDRVQAVMQKASL
ncbi:TIGR04282 family arsenosugar biosynthesis glycosyltransferase [Mariniblastus fucicola]|uniref:2-phospho-L-lactate guanylyltransferase n=1 Tax=Mariniblastus fucicola TaxID=980251 RepID=A0A5B9PPF9_9BACT|nr:TIGR04282 family arsenosugar biosynthesis glycosyltransferase [Mariniblastus fucicola]QEG24381.1 hypothetical protein MFFC18_43000 [Mariniblastus fucicola]